jgi:4-carboxymuconolactone decarboxylase
MISKPAFLSRILVLVCASAAAAQHPRLPQLKLEDTTGDQRALAERMLKQTRSGLTGPFNAMLRSPEMSQGLMDLYLYFRYKTALPRPLVELGILITAREWSTQFEWYMHYPIARTEGVSASLLAELRDGRRPAAMKPDEAAVYDFSTELLRRHAVADATYQRVISSLGEKNVVDLTALISTYATYAALLNVNQVKIPVSEGPEFLPVR